MVKRKAYRMLLVDDDDVFALLFSESIDRQTELRESFEVERVSDGNEALDYLLGEGGSSVARRPDVIVLDQRMPRMDGITVLEKIREHERTRGIPVCMLSTSSQARQVEACYAGGANVCITKPVDLNELVDKVGQMLHFFLNVMELPDTAALKAGA